MKYGELLYIQACKVLKSVYKNTESVIELYVKLGWNYIGNERLFMNNVTDIVKSEDYSFSLKDIQFLLKNDKERFLNLSNKEYMYEIDEKKWLIATMKELQNIMKQEIKNLLDDFDKKNVIDTVNQFAVQYNSYFKYNESLYNELSIYNDLQSIPMYTYFDLNKEIDKDGYEIFQQIFQEYNLNVKDFIN